MKCRVIRDDLEISPAYAPTIGEDRKEIRTIQRSGVDKFVPFWRRGAVIEHPDAWKLVRQGVAVPEDEECGKKCAMSQQQMDAAQWAYERVVRGIAPEDYDKFDAGIIEGYRDGEYIPGPNWHLLHGEDDEGGEGHESDEADGGEEQE